MANLMQRFGAWAVNRLQKMFGRPDSPAAVAARIATQSPGLWVSDHAEEASHFTGWNYCAVHGAAKRATMAAVVAFRRIEAPEELRTKAVGGNPDATPGWHEQPLGFKHPLSVLLRRPNPRQTWEEFIYQAVQQLRLTGSCHFMPVPNQLGYPVECWIIPTAIARPSPATLQAPEGGYWISIAGQWGLTAGIGHMSGFWLDARAIITARWPDSIYPGDGASPVNAGRLQIDVSEEIDRATLSGMRNGVRPDMAVSLDPNMAVNDKEIDRAEERLRARWSGSDRTGGVMIMRGMTPHQMSRSPLELDYVQGRNQARDVVLALHQTAPIACGITEAGSYAMYVAAMKQTADLSDQPDYTLIAATLERGLARPFGDDIGIKIVAKGFDDPSVLNQRIMTKLSSGSYTNDEIRAQFGDGPHPDAEIGSMTAGVRQTVRLDDKDPKQPGYQSDPPAAGSPVADEPDARSTRQDLPTIRRGSLNGTH